MKVLLISANTEQINMPVMPLGLACVKQAVKEAGYKVHALNLMTRADTKQKLPEILGSFIPDVIGISNPKRSGCRFGMDETGLFALWHSPDDRPENIIEENLQKALNICLEIVALSEDEKL